MREANRAACRRYYDQHASHIIAQKTLRLVRDQGRVPRARTLQVHGIDKDVVRGELQQFAKVHPESRAAQRIARRFGL